MLLAELEVFHSRPIAPTRRVAVGISVLPTAPAPGFGGLLLGAVASAFLPDIDPDLHGDLLRLTQELEAGRRIPQPRLRHRFQEDRVGLNRYRHHLIGTDEALEFHIDERGAPEPNVLAAVYAAGRLDPGVRPAVFAAMRRALSWRGELGSEFVAHLTDDRNTSSWTTGGGRDPMVWALQVFGLPGGDVERRLVQSRFRELLREAHPDHGGRASDAAARIAELSEARRILLA